MTFPAIAASFVLTWAGMVCASANGIAWDPAPSRAHDLNALRHGAQMFADYCLGCHSAAFMRYTKLRDLGLTSRQIRDNLLLTDSNIADTMQSSMTPQQAKAWLGSAPPDLTMIARSRGGPQGTGADYLYTYMRSFYRDTDRPTGWNNLVVPNVAMPHALWELQGQRRAVFRDVAPNGPHEFVRWEPLTVGTLTSEQYDQAVADLVGYLHWMGEPAQAQRQRVGFWVLLFLGAFSIITWRLNHAYWKDIR